MIAMVTVSCSKTRASYGIPSLKRRRSMCNTKESIWYGPRSSYPINKGSSLNMFTQPVFCKCGQFKLTFRDLTPQIGRDTGCSGMQWTVQDSNEGAREFCRRLNTIDETATEGWRVIHVAGDTYSQLAKSTLKAGSNIIFL